MNVHAPLKPALKVWFTAQELADASALGQMTGLPATRRGINDLADREGWLRCHALIKTEKGRGGTITRYHIDLLPLDVKTVYLARHFQVLPEESVPGTAYGGDGSLSGRAAFERDARLAVLRMADRFRRMSGLTKRSSDAMFAEVYNSGRVDMPGWVRGAVKSLSDRSLMRWRAEQDKLGHDRSEARKGTGILDTANDGAVKMFILGWMARSPALSAANIRDYVEDEFGAELVTRSGELKPVPPVRTFQHFLAGLKKTETVALTKITNPDKYRGQMKLVGTGAYSWVTEANQLWMIDASPADVLLKDGRHSIYGCIDIATRRYVITVSKTPRASAVALMIRKATLLWGVARVIKTDNGSDFKAREIERLFSSLDITADVSKAYSPAEKGHIERAIRTFQHDVCPQLPGYIGHNVAERKAIEERRSFAQRLGESDEVLFEVALTAVELQAHIDDWLEHVYHHREHDGLDGRTPAQAAAASTGTIRRVDERALDMLLMPVAGGNGLRTMTKQGLKIEGNYYMTGLVLVGTQVFVRMDPVDMGKAYVYAADGEKFIDIAVCPKLADIDRTAYVAETKRQYSEMVNDRVREIRSEVRKLQRGASGIERTIRLAKRKSSEREAASANVFAFPRREETHSTPQIAAALTAAENPRPETRAKPLADMAAQLHEAIVREAEQKGAANVVPINAEASLSERARKFKWALALEERIAAGVTIDDPSAVQLVRFQATGDYQSMKDCLKDFGLENTLRMF